MDAPAGNLLDVAADSGPNLLDQPAPNLLAAHFNLFVGHTGLRERGGKCCFVGTAQAFTRV